jgi:hypothetical protein
VKKIVLFIFLLLFCSLPLRAEDTAIPVINEVIPPKAKVDEKVTIKGSNFHKEKKKNIVRFGTVTAEVLEASPDTLVVTVPKGAKVGGLSVEVMGHHSKDIRFYVLPYLEFQLAEKNMTPGQKTKGFIKVHGSQKPWKIRVINKYYEVIDLPGGNDQVVVSSGGEDNKVELDIMAKQMGNFSLICRKIEELDEVPATAAKTHQLPVTPTPTPESSSALSHSPSPEPTHSVASEPSPSPSPRVTRISSIKPSPTPQPTRSTAVKPLLPIETLPEPTRTPAVKATPAPEPTGSTAIKPASPTETVPEPTPERPPTASPQIPSPAPVTTSVTTAIRETPAAGSTPNKSAVLAYCAKLKDRIGGLRSQSEKLRAQLEEKFIALGRQRGIDDSKKQARLASIDDRGKKIAGRLAEIPKDREDLKKDPEKNKTKIDNLDKEETKLKTEQKNNRIWKKKLASDSSKQAASLQKTIKALSDKRNDLEKQIKKLQDEYDSKLKSLIAAS